MISPFLLAEGRLYGSRLQSAPPITYDELYARAGQVPSLDLRYDRGSIVDVINGITPTFTRPSSTKLVWNGSQLVSVAANVPAFQVDPLTRRLGYLHEPAATNQIRNNSMVGANAGTPGALPTNWIEGGVPAGVSRQVVGTAIENGVQCVDIRYSGTAASNSTSLIGFDGNTTIAALNATTYAISVFAKSLSGVIPVTSLTLSQRDAGGSFLSDLSQAIAPTPSLARYAVAFTTNNASIAFYNPRITFAFLNGVTYDFTMRFGWPQAELGTAATSPIITSGSAVTRAADTMSVSGVSFTGGTLYVEAFKTGNGTRPLMSFNDGTVNERIELITSGTNPILNVVDGGVSQASVDGGTFAANSIIKVAAAVGANNFAVSVNGGAPIVNSSGTMPTIDRLFIGTDQAGSRSVGPIYRAMWFPPGAAGSRIQQMTL